MVPQASTAAMKMISGTAIWSDPRRRRRRFMRGGGYYSTLMLETAGAGVAEAALGFRHVCADVHGMAERLGFQPHVGELLRWALRQDRVAGVAILLDDLPLAALVQPVMAAKTPLGGQVADMVGMCAPVRTHLRKDVSGIHLLDFHRGLLDRRRLVTIEPGILPLIKLFQI